MERGFQEVFNWGFVASFAIASTAVLAIANTLRQWWKLEPRWSALVASEVLAFYAAVWGEPSFTIGRFRAGARSDNPVYLGGRDRIYEGMRQAGIPE